MVYDPNIAQADLSAYLCDRDKLFREWLESVNAKHGETESQAQEDKRVAADC